MQKKKQIRLHIREQFRQLQHKQVKEKRERVYEQLFSSGLWKKAVTVGITVSTRNEISTIPIIEKGWGQGKHMAIPKVAPSLHSLDFYSFTSFQQTKLEFAGISEPEPELTSLVPNDTFDLIIVPGMAFDKDKYRIGFGGGYYDRFLQRTTAVTCALLYDFQLYERLPREEHDIPMDTLITESCIF